VPRMLLLKHSQQIRGLALYTLVQAASGYRHTPRLDLARLRFSRPAIFLQVDFSEARYHLSRLRAAELRQGEMGDFEQQRRTGDIGQRVTGAQVLPVDDVALVAGHEDIAGVEVSVQQPVAAGEGVKRREGLAFEVGG
jgi:hypothetical protein